jgi:2-keto-4-pentenoate hydratase
MSSVSQSPTQQQPTAPFDPAQAAVLLARAWRTGTQITELPADVRPRTLDEGYDVQDSLIAQMGEPVAGWKLGVGSPGAMRSGGLARPLVGRLLASHVHRSCATVPLPTAAPTTLEFEVAFVLGRDIAPGDAPRPLRELISSAHVTFEFVRSRFVNRRGVGWPSFAGDSVGFEALVVGDAIDPDDIDRIVQSVVITVDGNETARALAGDDLTDPWSAFADLIDHARDRGITLDKGHVITTGALAKPFDIADRGVHIVARYLNSEISAFTTVPAIGKEKA